VAYVTGGKMDAKAAEHDIKDHQLHVEKLKLTDDQEKVREKLKEDLKKEKLWDEDFCTDEELARFCKARNFEYKKVLQMTSDAIKWRRDAKPHHLRPTLPRVVSEGQTGKTYVAGKDKYGRPVVVMDSSCENSKDHQSKIDFLLFNLEHAKRLMEGSVDKWVLWIYLDNFSFFSAPPMKTSMETNRCLMLRYPERMGHCILYQPPTLFNVCWKMASPLIDPRTKQKIHFMSGKFDKDSPNAQKLNGILGEGWRDLVGIDTPHSATKARGYDQTKYWSSLEEFYKSNPKEEAKRDTPTKLKTGPNTMAPPPPPGA